ncbi:hypothetical protein XENORESO_017706, partial [Xenotaenia resolanae]
PPKTPTLLRFNIFSLQSAEETSFKDVSVLCSYKSRLPVMQSEEGFWFQSLQFQGLSETHWWLQLLIVRPPPSPSGQSSRRWTTIYEVKFPDLCVY